MIKKLHMRYGPIVIILTYYKEDDTQTNEIMQTISKNIYSIISIKAPPCLPDQTVVIACKYKNKSLKI